MPTSCFFFSCENETIERKYGPVNRVHSERWWIWWKWARCSTNMYIIALTTTMDHRKLHRNVLIYLCVTKLLHALNIPSKTSRVHTVAHTIFTGNKHVLRTVHIVLIVCYAIWRIAQINNKRRADKLWTKAIKLLDWISIRNREISTID